MDAPRSLLSMEAERREYLKQYILACIRTNALSWGDLSSPAIFDKLLRTLSKDTRAVVVELGRSGGAGLLRMVGTALGGIAEDVVLGKTRR